MYDTPAGDSSNVKELLTRNHAACLGHQLIDRFLFLLFLPFRYVRLTCQDAAYGSIGH